MNRLYVFPVAFSLVLYLGLPAFAQHNGRGLGGSFGKAPGGMPSTFSGDGKGHVGRETGSPVGDATKDGASKGSSSVTDKKTAGDLLKQDTKLSSNLQGLLPSGTNVEDAAKGFDHLGEFVAAVHVSHNLGVPFDQLKSEMMNGSSLGQAIHKFKPNADARQEAIKGNQQALDDMEKSAAAKKSAAAAVK
jgi:hypothetical protein